MRAFFVGFFRALVPLVFWQCSGLPKNSLPRLHKDGVKPTSSNRKQGSSQLLNSEQKNAPLPSPRGGSAALGGKLCMCWGCLLDALLLICAAPWGGAPSLRSAARFALAPRRNMSRRVPKGSPKEKTTAKGKKCAFRRISFQCLKYKRSVSVCVAPSLHFRESSRASKCAPCASARCTPLTNHGFWGEGQPPKKGAISHEN